MQPAPGTGAGGGELGREVLFGFAHLVRRPHGQPAEGADVVEHLAAVLGEAVDTERGDPLGEPSHQRPQRGVEVLELAGDGLSGLVARVGRHGGQDADAQDGGGFGDPVEFAQGPIGGLPVGAFGLASVGRADVEFVEQCHQTVDVGDQLLLRSVETARGERFVDVGDAPAGEGLGTAHAGAPA